MRSRAQTNERDERTTPVRLYGVGLGPGDPDYMTVEAARRSSRAPTGSSHFCSEGKRGNARTIADAAVGVEPAREIALVYPVTTEIPTDDPDYAAAIRPFYEEAAARLCRRLKAGRSVAVLCEGDPFFYGSFMHLWCRLRDRVPIEVVPAVTGMSGRWTRAGTPIIWGDDVLTVIPGTLSEAESAAHLARTDAAVVMKLGRNLPRSARAEGGRALGACNLCRARHHGGRDASFRSRKYATRRRRTSP